MQLQFSDHAFVIEATRVFGHLIGAGGRYSMHMALSYQEYRSRKHIKALDGIRAVSIILVFTAHPAYRPVWSAFHGAAGVTIFFVLSGFLITTLLLREEERKDRVDIRAFFIRRIFRIYPMYFLILGAYCTLILVLGLQSERRAGFVENVPYFILFAPEHAMFFNDTGVEVPFNMSWSIGVEEKFYLVWPVLGFVLLKSRTSWRVPLLIAAVAIFGATGLLWRHGDAVAPYGHIALGCLAAVILHSESGYRFGAALGRPKSLMFVSLLAVVFQFGTAEILPLGNLYAVYGIVVTLLLIGLVTTKAHVVHWLSSKPMTYIAKLSFGLYLVHNFGLNAAEMVVPGNWGFLGSLLSTGLGIGASIVVCDLLYRFFENPVRSFGVRLSKRRKERQAMTLPGAAANRRAVTADT